jgi:hypothetical protein
LDSNTVSARVDHNLRESDRLSLIYHRSRFNATTADRFAGAIPIEGGGDGDASEVRIEAFNLTNTPHFANPNADLSSGDAGTITRTVENARILQFALRFMS